jgi:predicted oxidoreductase
MTLKERLIEEIAQLSPAELIAVTQVVDALKRTPPAARPAASKGYEKTRKALAGLHTDLSEDVLRAREERL